MAEPTNTTKMCAVQGCDRSAYKAGFCNPHYIRKRRGRPMDTPYMAQPIRATLEDRLWAKIERRGPDECWVWSGATVRGYGHITLGRKGEGTALAHRVAYSLAHGPISDDLFVCHRCDNPPCCNPAHLFAGTPGDNVQDMIAKGRQKTKLTDRQASDAIRRLSVGETASSIALTMGVSDQTIYAIKQGRNWKRLR